MPLRSLHTRNVFFSVPNNSHSVPLPRSRRERKQTVVFLLPGNPGLISYYNEFLSLLAGSKVGRGCVIFGASLGGFEVGGDDSEGGEEALLWPKQEDWVEFRESKQEQGKLWGLREQVKLCFGRMEGVVRQIRKEGESRAESTETEGTGKEEDSEVVDDGKIEVEIILMGHSVGAWIALEVRRLWWEKYQLQNTTLSMAGARRGLKDRELSPSKGMPQTQSYAITASILLTPTIIDLAQSPSGQLATPLLSNLPFLPTLMQTITATLRWPLSDSWLRYVVAKATGQTGDGLETTLSFLRSERGVQQALYLARDEMRIITEDRWGEEVWVASGKEHGTGGAGRKKLFFLFAKNDHWVADRTREEILKFRGGEEGRRRGRTVIVDENEGLVHAWCLQQNDVVARMVGGWLEDVLDTGERKS